MKLKHKLSILLLMGTFISSAHAQTDAVLVSTKPMIPYGINTGTNSVTTGITVENGEVWIWGFRGSGQQGNGDKVVSPPSTAPARVEKFVNNGLNIIQTAAGIYHMIALDDKGDVWGWGQNGYQEADGGVCPAGYVSSPCQILKDQHVVMIGAGEYTSYALTQDGDVYAWGNSTYGQVGNGDKKARNALYKIPRSKFNDQKVIMIGSAYEGGYAINEIGEVFGWGDEQKDSFGYDNGNQNHVYVTEPKKLNISMDGRNIDYICGGEAYTLYLTNDGKVYGIGRLNMLGQGIRGDKTEPKTATPVFIKDNVNHLYCRFAGAVAITYDQKLYTWGSNGTVGDRYYYIYGEVPTQRQYNDVITKIDGGKESIMYWTDTGKGYGVGYGNDSKFEQGTNRDIDWPGKELTFLMNEMKNVYGPDYVLGQGQ